MSPSTLLARAQTDESFIAPAISATESKSPFDETGKPASITSTRILSSAFATSSFSSGFIEHPGACSPSLSVVSNIFIVLGMLPSSL